MRLDAAREGRLLEARLKQIRDKDYLPPDMIDLLEVIGREQLNARPVATVNVPDEFPEDRELLLGRSLVDRERFPYDENQALELFSRFLDLSEQSSGPLSVAAGEVRQAMDQGELDPADAFVRVLKDDADYFNAWAKRTPQAPQTLYFLAFAALGPSLAAAGEILAGKLPEVTAWTAGTCPVCGELPLISSLREKSGYRWDTCSFCRHEYRVRRMACAVCGETDQNKLTFFTVDDEPGYRVDVCASCKSYIKTIDFREMDRVTLPQFDDLDSLALDFVAREQGYARPTLSAWGF